MTTKEPCGKTWDRQRRIDDELQRVINMTALELTREIVDMRAQIEYLRDLRLPDMRKRVMQATTREAVKNITTVLIETGDMRAAIVRALREAGVEERTYE